MGHHYLYLAKEESDGLGSIVSNLQQPNGILRTKVSSKKVSEVQKLWLRKHGLEHFDPTLYWRFIVNP
jgi:hypothetical protein